MVRIIKNIVMNEELTRLWLINWSAIFISFQNIDNVLRILLLMVSIVYTGIRIVKMLKNDKTNED